MITDNNVDSAPAIIGNTVTNFLELNIAKIKNECENGEVDILDTCKLNVRGLILFALIQTILEIYDADHDLNRSKYDKNPFVEYCRSFVGEYPKFVFINNQIIALDDDNLGYILDDKRWKSTSQSAIKNNMENILKDLNSKFLKDFGRIPYTSSITKEPKQLVDLQLSLNTKDIDLTIVETHRGGLPINDRDDVSIMLKGTASTRFDLGSVDFPKIKNENIKDNFCGLVNDFVYNYTNKQDLPKIDLPDYTGPKSPLCRFFSNYFPNSFTIVIKKSELTVEKLTGIFRQMGNYFSHFGKTNEEVAQMLVKQINKKKKQNPRFFPNNNNTDETYLLHMFMDINKDGKGNPTFNPTFSIQKGQITADQVTEALYGVKHRCLSSKTQPKLISDSLLILDDNITAFVKFCHILYAKTIGDGIAIEIVKILAKIFGITVNLLSNDVCCTYRNVFVNGFSTRQAPSSLAGTGFGSLSPNRNVEILSMINPTTTTLSQCIEKIISEYNQSKINITPIDETGARTEKYFDMDGIVGFDNDALDDILTCAYSKIYQDEYNRIAIGKQNDIIALIKNLKEAELTIEKTDCELLKELCMNPQLLFIKTKVDNSFENFKDRLKNILKKIQVDYPLLIQTRVTIIDVPNDDTHNDEIASILERGISLVSSLEQLLGEVYPCKNDEFGLKKIVLYFLTVVIQKSIIPAHRITTRYIEMLKDRLIRIIKVEANLKNKDVNHLSIESSYEELLNVFNSLFNGFDYNYQNDPVESKRYKRRQQAKQPLNLLKFISRSIEAKNSWDQEKNSWENKVDSKVDSNLYQYIKNNYESIIESSQSASPSATQQLDSYKDSYNSYNDSYNDSYPVKTDNISNEEAAKELEKKIKELENSDSNLSGSKSDMSPEDIAYIVEQTNAIGTPPIQITRPRLYKNEDDLSVAIAPAPDGDTRMIEITKDQEYKLKDTIEADDYNKLIDISSQNENPIVDTEMTVNSGGKPSRKTKNKRNKITRNKKSKNNQTKKHKRTKRRKVI